MNNKRQNESNLIVHKILGMPFTSDKIKFVWDDEKVDNFSNYNIIYGRNGSGKSTIATMLANIKGYRGKRIDAEESAVENIKVFSREYTHENLYFKEIDDPNGDPKIKLIDVDLGKPAIKAVGKIKDQLIELKRNLENDKKNLITLLQPPASNIKNRIRTFKEGRYELSWDDLDKKLDDYSSDIEKLLEENLDESTIESRIVENENIIKEEEKHEIKLFSEKIISLKDKSLDFLTDLKEKISRTLVETAISEEEIKKIIQNPNFHEWIQQGYSIHTEYNMDKECAFCRTKFSDDRLKERLRDLQDYLVRSTSSIDKDLKEWEGAINDARIPVDDIVKSNSATEILSKFSKEYIKAIENFQEEARVYNGVLDSLTKKIENKKNNPAVKIDCDDVCLPERVDISDKVLRLDKIINNNNLDVKKTKENKDEALANFIILLIIQFDIYQKRNVLKEKIKHAENERTKLNDKKVKLDNVIKNDNASLKYINGIIHDFFNNTRISFAPSKNREGTYTILRGEEPARYLSEGEKNILGLIYFYCMLGPNKSNGVKQCLVFDDPLTSLDSENFYRCIDLILDMANNKKLVCQSIILTHSIKLVKTIRYDFSFDKNITKYYHLTKSSDENDKNKEETRMNKLDQSWLDSLTEYNLIFREVMKFYNILKDGKELSPVQKRQVLNPLRRLLESIGRFYFPNSRNFSGILKQLFGHDDKKYSEVIGSRSALNKIFHIGSHSTDIPEPDIDIDTESLYDKVPDALEASMLRIKELAEEHYQEMETWCKNYDRKNHGKELNENSSRKKHKEQEAIRREDTREKDTEEHSVFDNKTGRRGNGGGPASPDSQSDTGNGGGPASPDSQLDTGNGGGPASPDSQSDTGNGGGPASPDSQSDTGNGGGPVSPDSQSDTGNGGVSVSPNNHLDMSNEGASSSHDEKSERINDKGGSSKNPQMTLRLENEEDKIN